MTGLLVGGSSGSLVALIPIVVVKGSLGVLCVVLECCIWFMIQDRILVSTDCPILWRLCASERPCAVVAPLWSPTRSSRILALGSCNMFLKYIRPGPGMPCSRQNA